MLVYFRYLRVRLATVLAFFLVLGLLADAAGRRWTPKPERAAHLLRLGKPAEAARLYWELVDPRLGVPKTDYVFALVEACSRAWIAAALQDRSDAPRIPGTLGDTHGSMPTPRPPREGALPPSRAEVEARLSQPDVTPEIRTLIRFILGGNDISTEIKWSEPEPEQDEDPPTEPVSTPSETPPTKDALETEVQALAERGVPWSNRLLGRRALMQGRLAEAITRFEREALADPGHARDLDVALEMRLRQHDYDGMGRTLSDSRLRAVADPYYAFRHAVEVRNLRASLEWSARTAFQRPPWGPLLLSICAGVSWFVFCARVGELSARPWTRGALYLGALVLGMVSTWPTLLLIAWQESVLHLTPNGTPMRDAIFYVMGVGFREELSKLLLFLPLLPFLRARRCRIEVITCAALVGLGFAVQENLGYFGRSALPEAMARHLTANFLHIAMTTLVASSFESFTHDMEGQSLAFTQTFFRVVLLHGAYDFFLSSSMTSGMSFFAMAVFVLLTRSFVETVHVARRGQRQRALLPTFAYGTVFVAGVSFLYAAHAVGWWGAFQVLAAGALGMAVVVYLFARELEALPSRN